MEGTGEEDRVVSRERRRDGRGEKGGSMKKTPKVREGGEGEWERSREL